MKSINKITVLNLFSTVLLQGIAFFTTPIFTRMLGARQYGLYSVFFFRLDILVCFIGAGIGSSIGTAIYAYKEKYLEYRSSSLLLTTGFSVGFIIVANIFISQVCSLLSYETYLVECLLFLAAAYNIVGFVQAACIYEKKAGLNFVISVTLSVASVVLSLVFIPKMNEGVRYLGRVYGVAVPYIIVAIIIWLVIFWGHPGGIKKEYALYGLTYGIPIIFHVLARSVLAQSDREMMVRMGIADEDVGIYSFFCTFTAVLTIVMNSLFSSWTPFYYDDISNENCEGLNQKCSNVIELFTILTVGFLLLSREVSKVFSGEEFWRGIQLIPVLVLAIYFMFLYQFPVSYEFYYKKTKFVAMGTAIAACINIILNIYMIKWWGMYGAAIATTVSYFALFIIHYIFVNYITKQKYHLKLRNFIPSFACVGLGILSFYLLSDVKILRWTVGGILGIIEITKLYQRRTIF